MHKQKTYKKTLIKLFVLLVLVIIIVLIILNKNDIFKRDKDNFIEINDNNSLIGTFLYKEDGTRYEFKPDGSGSMSSETFNYEYTYTTQDNSLNIDFIVDEVHDVKYTYSISDNILTLISLEGTISTGEEYKLEKVNK